MRRRTVVSSVLRSVGYDAERLVLEIEFVGGRVYQYLGVPEILHRRLLAARSLGSFFNAEIRDAYRTVRALVSEHPARQR